VDELDRRCVPEASGDDRAAIMSIFYWEAMRMIAEAGAVEDDDMRGLAQACAAEGIEWKPVGMKAFLEKWWGGV
jgi:hypothetical protein